MINILVGLFLIYIIIVVGIILAAVIIGLITIGVLAFITRKDFDIQDILAEFQDGNF